MDCNSLTYIIESLAFEGKEYNEIESEIKKYEELFSESELKYALGLISENMAAYQIAKQQKAEHLNHIFIGIILLILGLVFTLGTFFSGLSSVVITFGLIIYGFFIIYNGIKDYNRPLQNPDRKNKLFKRKY